MQISVSSALRSDHIGPFTLEAGGISRWATLRGEGVPARVVCLLRGAARSRTRPEGLPPPVVTSPVREAVDDDASSRYCTTKGKKALEAVL